MIKALIFDLDNCLAAADEVGEQLLAPVFDAIRDANRGTLSETELQAAFADCWRHPLDWVAARHGFTGEMLEAGWEILATREVEQPMYGYGDLDVVSDLPQQRYLVTSGFRRLQESKIRALGVERLFTAIEIDAIDEPGRKGKRRIFEDILDRNNFKPEEVLVVGDNADSEIEAGKRLGIRTVQTLRPGVPRSDRATFHVNTLTELKRIIVEASEAAA